MIFSCNGPSPASTMKKMQDTLKLKWWFLVYEIHPGDFLKILNICRTINSYFLLFEIVYSQMDDNNNI